MKTSTLFALFVSTITCCAVGQAGGGASGGGAAASGSAAAPAASGSAATPAQSGTAAAPAQSGSAANPAAPPTTPATTSQQLIERNQAGGVTNSPFSPAISNQFGMTNTVNTNEFGNKDNEEEEERERREHREHRDRDRHGTNELAPTGGATGTNQFNNNIVFQDQSFTTADQSLLVTLRQRVQTQLGVTTTGTMPVHFVINNGVVTLVGTVPSTIESQRILLLAQQTPGVAQVNNRLQVSAATSGAVQPITTPNPGFVGATTDHAFSPADRQLLFKVQQSATQQLGETTQNGMQLPVHFSIQNGVVSIMGQVASPQQKQSLLAAIQNTPGVTRVVDDVSVASTAPAATANPSMNDTLAPTSTGSQSNAIFQNSTNMSP